MPPQGDEVSEHKYYKQLTAEIVLCKKQENILTVLETLKKAK